MWVKFSLNVWVEPLKEKVVEDVIPVTVNSSIEKELVLLLVIEVVGLEESTTSKCIPTVEPLSK